MMMIIHDVAQNTESWFMLRAGKPTASMFGQVLTPKTSKPSTTDYPFQLAAEILAGYDCDEWLGNAHTDHGHEAEMHAAKEYMDLTGVEPIPVGFVTDDAETIGCSPDRLVGDNGLLEIKSLMAKNIIKIYSEYLETKLCPSEYKMQIQGQLMITERDWCDLVLYHPRLSLKVIRVLPDVELHEKLKDQLQVIINQRDKAVDIMADF